MSLDPRHIVASAFEAFENHLDDFDEMYFTATNEHLGAYYRAWHSLEPIWLSGIEFPDLAESFDIGRIRLPSPPDRLLWLADMFGLLSGELPIWYVSPVLYAAALRQGVHTIDARSYVFGDDAELTRTYDDMDVRRTIYRIQRAVSAAGEVLEDAIVAELLDLSREELDEISELPPDRSYDLARRLKQSKESSETRLRRVYFRHPKNRDIAVALATHLALTGRPGDGEQLFESLCEENPEPDSFGAIVHSMLIDSRCAQGKRDTAKLASFVEQGIPIIQAFTDGLWDAEWNVVDHYLLHRSWMVAGGLIPPFSSESATPTPIESWTPTHVELHNADRGALLEAIYRQIEAFRTQVGALQSELHTQFARDSFLLQQITQLMPRQKRQDVINEIRKRCTKWTALPQRAKDQLIAARYLGEDSELSAPEAVTSQLVAIGVAVEVTCKELLNLSSRLQLGGIGEILERECREPWVDQFRRVRDVRNESAHEVRSLPRQDVTDAWEILLNDGNRKGILDEIVEFAEQRHNR